MTAKAASHDEVKTPPEARKIMEDHPGWLVWVGLNNCRHGRLLGTNTLVHGDNAQDICDGITSV